MDDNEKFYCQIADDRVGNWRDIGKNELFNLYIKHEKNQYLREGYFAAILLKYWNLINSKRIRSCGYASYDDCYNWLVDSVYTALSERKWKDPSNKLYMDKRGPDKVINKLMKMHLVTHFQTIKKDKHKVNMNVESTDDMNDEYSFEVSDIDVNIYNADMYDLIHSLCVSGDYISAIVSHFVCFDSIKTYSTSEVCDECIKYIHETPTSALATVFNEVYHSNVTEKTLSDIQNMDNVRLLRNIQYSLYKLSKKLV